LPPFLFQATIGLKLGDLFAERLKKTQNTRLNFEQSANNAPYLLYLYSLFIYFLCTGPKSPKRNAHLKTGKIYPSLAFKTLRFPCFNIFHDLFYSTTWWS
jgi:hypothetical protein